MNGLRIIALMAVLLIFGGVGYERSGRSQLSSDEKKKLKDLFRRSSTYFWIYNLIFILAALAFFFRLSTLGYVFSFFIVLGEIDHARINHRVLKGIKQLNHPKPYIRQFIVSQYLRYIGAIALLVILVIALLPKSG